MLRYHPPWHWALNAHMHCEECGALVTHDPEAEPWAYCPPCRATFTRGVGVPVVEWPTDPTAIGVRVTDIDWSQPIPDPPSTRRHGVGQRRVLPRQSEEEWHRCPRCGSGNTEAYQTNSERKYRNCRSCIGRYVVERTNA